MTKQCELCGESEAIISDYRPRKDLYKTGFKFDYKTPLSCYSIYKVCNECFHASDKAFFGRLPKTEKEVALNDA